jgi:uncharacterized membrane protein YdbT with pleckstrin-like domain
MAFPRRLLIPGEDLVLDLRPHPVALAVPAIVTIVGLVAVVWIAASTGFADWLWWVVFVVVLVAYPVRRLVWWLTSIFAVTTDRVIHREGWIAKRSMEIPLEAINDVRFEQGVFDRMIGAGSLIIQSASEQGRQEFEHIRHPEDVQKTIYEQGETNKKRMYRGEHGGSGGGSSAPSVSSELERLAELRAKGILTEQEFQAQKAKVLGDGG